MKLASCSWPSVVGVALAAVVTLTVPSAPIEIDLASAGTMMPGSTVLPLLVTIWPLGSSWKLPSRV